MRKEGLKVSGVLELYSDVTPFVVKIKKATIELAVIFLVILSLLYGVLIFIVRHADQILKLQYADLQRSEEDIKSKISELEHEIMERKISEEALTKNEERFKDFAEASADRFWEMDKEFRFTYFSDDTGAKR